MEADDNTSDLIVYLLSYLFTVKIFFICLLYRSLEKWEGDHSHEFILVRKQFVASRVQFMDCSYNVLQHSTYVTSCRGIKMSLLSLLVNCNA